jgi:hypothetical protein
MGCDQIIAKKSECFKKRATGTMMDAWLRELDGDDGKLMGFRRSIAGIRLGSLRDALLARGGLGESLQASARTRARQGRPEVWPHQRPEAGGQRRARSQVLRCPWKKNRMRI